MELNPGDTRNINCTEFCDNETLEIQVNDCPEENATECGVCSIDTSLHWNQTYNNSEGPCDIKVHCEPMNLTQLGTVNFPTKMKVKKEGGSFQLSIDVHDKNDHVLESWVREISQEDVVEYAYEFNYTCPAELTTEVNMHTCAPFLENYFNVTDPVIFQIVTGQTLCMERLVECQSVKDSEIDQAHAWEQKYKSLLDEYNDIEADYEACSMNLDYNNHNSTLYRTVKAVRNEKAGWVEPHWFWISIVLIILIAITLLYTFVGGGSE